MRRAALAAVLVMGALASCKKEPRPIVGLHSAAAPLYLLVRGVKRPVAVGSRLSNDDHIIASGPAMLEFFGGAVRFVSQGEELDLGDATEAKLMSSNLRSVIVRGTNVVELAPSKRPVAARYMDTNFTPAAVLKEPETGDYLRAFFTPNGMEKLGQQAGGPLPDGPRHELPPPPLRPHVPHLHAGELGRGGPIVDVEGGSAAAETDDFASALLLDGNSYDLGQTERLYVPKGASVTFHWADTSRVSVDGPAEVHLR